MVRTILAKPTRRPARIVLRPEALEDRLVPSSFYVAVDGNDGNSGLSPTQAFATIQHALDTATAAGDTVFVEGGTYHEEVSLSTGGNASQGPITLTAFQGQTAVLDASGLTASGTAIDVTAGFVTVSGLQIENAQTTQAAAGITIEGNASHVTVSDNVITNVRGPGAYGIVVNGTTDPKGRLSDLTIAGNTVDGIASTADPGANGTYGIWLYDPTNRAAQINTVTIGDNQVFNITTAAGNKNDDCSGIRVEGAATAVTVSGNSIHEINGPEDLSQVATDTSPSGMGITVYGASKTPVSNLTIEQNQVFDCQLGMSEAVTLNGNITGFQVTGNVVHDVSNIGIDCIGGDASIDIGWTGAGISRNGTVSGNTVFNAHSTYGGGFAGGIYVDGGKTIVLTDNVTHDNDIGLEVGAEHHGIVASGITVSDNLIYQNAKAGLAFGGYQASVGRVNSCDFVNNTLWNNDTAGTGDGQLWIQDGSNDVVANNIFEGVGSEALVGSFPDVKNAGIQLDFNLYFSPAGPTDPTAFTWNNVACSGFAAFQKLSHQDTHSLFADPDLAAPTDGNFTLAAGSPAIEAGTSKHLWFAPVDFTGQKRTLPPDIGAY
jgi:hypothetical protein